MFTTVTCCEEIGKKLFKHRTEVCERAYFGICIGITASESLLSKFQDFPGPCTQISKTFWVLEILQTQFQDFPRGTGTPN